MNDYEYGSRLPPLLRVRDVRITVANITVTEILPRNRHRWGALLEGPLSGTVLYYFSEDSPTDSTAFPVSNNTGSGGLISYCMVGNLIWRPIWAYQAGGAPLALHAYEFTLPQEAWEVILKQGLLPGRPL